MLSGENNTARLIIGYCRGVSAASDGFHYLVLLLQRRQQFVNEQLTVPLGHDVRELGCPAAHEEVRSSKGRWAVTVT